MSYNPDAASTVTDTSEHEVSMHTSSHVSIFGDVCKVSPEDSRALKRSEYSKSFSANSVSTRGAYKRRKSR